MIYPLRPHPATFPILMLLVGAAMLPASPAGAHENERLVLGRHAVAWGGSGSAVALDLATAAAPGVAQQAEPEAERLALYPGFLAPYTDRLGLITHARIEDVLLGRAVPPEPVAMDLAGNRDGRIDVGDLLMLNRRLIP